MKKVLSGVMLISLMTSLVSLAKAATLGADPQSINSKATSIEKEYSQSMRDERNSMTYSSTLNMRENLRMGAGVSVGGPLGVVGVQGEFNFEDENGVVAGFGTGPGYNSIGWAWKHVFEGDYLAPYVTAGYSRWYNSRGHDDNWKQSSILSRVLTDGEKKSGQFGTNFMNLSLGLQYNQLSGVFYGFSCYAEIVGMYEVSRSQLIPSGTVGSIYYF